MCHPIPARIANALSSTPDLPETRTFASFKIRQPALIPIQKLLQIRNRTIVPVDHDLWEAQSRLPALISYPP
jgi:hypothetical protein